MKDGNLNDFQFGMFVGATQAGLHKVLHKLMMCGLSQPATFMMQKEKIQ